MDYGVYSNGHLKSALQKFVRRGMKQEAAAVAVALAQRGMSLFKRLPVIVAEDIGWEFVTPVFEECRRLSDDVGMFGRSKDLDLDAIAKLVRMLAALPKDRDCGGLAGLATLANERQPLAADVNALRAAIESKNELMAMRHCEQFAAGRQRRLVWDALRAAAGLDGASRLQIEGIRGQSYRGVLPGDELILMAAGIFALTRTEVERRRVLAGSRNDATGDSPGPLPWFVFDMHTEEGRAVLAELKAEGVNSVRLASCWWYWESASVDVELGQLARLERESRGFHESTKTEWLGYLPRVRQGIEMRVPH